MKKYISYFYVVTGAACWGFIGVFNRMLAQAGVTVGSRVLIRNMGALLVMTLFFALFRREVFHIKWKHF